MPMEPRVTQSVNQSASMSAASAEKQTSAYARLDWILLAAARNKDGKMNVLTHHLNRTNLAQAFRSLRANAASGIDAVTKQEYQKNLNKNLQALERRLQLGNWMPKPSREVLIPKPQGGTRPLAIGCTEDKIVQTLVARILEAVYEPIFHRHSFGFRKGRSAHQAVGRLYSVISKRRQSCVVVEMDIEKFFNSVNQRWLLDRLEERIGDKRFLKLIGRLLAQSVLHTDGALAETTRGTPQGSPVSPVLANICLHHLMDTWFQQNWSRKGQFVRYADDAVFVFTNEQDAAEFQSALAARLNEAGLNLNVDKSGVVPFSSHKPKGTISFLGFELYWGKRINSKVLKVKTQPKKLHRAMLAFTDWIKSARNRKTTTKLLDLAAAKIRGHFNYFGVMYNESKLKHFHWVALGSLFKWLNRRSQKRSMSWQKFERKIRFSSIPLPPLGRQLHDIRFETGSDRNHQLKSRMRKLRTSGSERSASQVLAFT